MTARLSPWRMICCGAHALRVVMMMLALIMPTVPALAVQVDADVDDPTIVVSDETVSDELHEVDAHGGHGEAEQPGLLGFNPGAAIWNLVIFLLVLFVLGMFVWPQILAGLQAREDKIRTDLQSAETANREARTALAGYQRQLDDAQAKIQEMFAEARRDAEQAGARIVEEAKADAERQRQRALADIEAAKVTAISELANQTSDLAISLARQVVGRELNPHDHADLIRQSLDRMPTQRLPSQN